MGRVAGLTATSRKKSRQPGRANMSPTPRCANCRLFCCISVCSVRSISFGSASVMKLASPRRRRALTGIKLLPVAGETRRMGAARIGCHAELAERIGLAADVGRHLLKLDPIVTQRRLALDARSHLTPRRNKPIGRYPLRKILGQERRVIIVQILAEPAQPP